MSGLAEWREARCLVPDSDLRLDLSSDLAAIERNCTTGPPDSPTRFVPHERIYRCRECDAVVWTHQLLAWVLCRDCMERDYP